MLTAHHVRLSTFGSQLLATQSWPLFALRQAAVCGEVKVRELPRTRAQGRADRFFGQNHEALNRAAILFGWLAGSLGITYAGDIMAVNLPPPDFSPLSEFLVGTGAELQTEKDSLAERGGFEPPVPLRLIWAEFGSSLAHY
jgi:hypothetical protein